MDEARALVARLEARGRDPYSGTIILARELTNGRGRMGRTWFGPPGGVYLALLVAPETMPERIGLYPLAAGLAACAAVREHLPEARLKWVNDVLSSGRKVCGLLAESFHSARHRQEYLLLGVGLNANISGFPPELDGLATSLCLELGRQVDLDRLTVRLITWLRFYIGLLHHHDQRLLEAGLAEGLAGGDAPTDPLLAAFRLVSDTFGRGVLYRGGDGDPGVRARAIDLADDGGLILEHEGGGRHTAHGGEILYLD
jgi:BirA family biotin operon repressor/biotin-[acetyl-CoA-carboxylase] ligase